MAVEFIKTKVKFFKPNFLEEINIRKITGNKFDIRGFIFRGCY